MNNKRIKQWRITELSDNKIVLESNVSYVIESAELFDSSLELRLEKIRHEAIQNIKKLFKK